MDDLFLDTYYFCINRNILECKGTFCWWFWCSNWVLIETYWNVKANMSLTEPCDKCINRNILECKGDSNRDEPGRKSSINRNILECKVLNVVLKLHIR